ncbi:MAG: aldo/keto reductase [Acidimicrobiales bacterium]
MPRADLSRFPGVTRFVLGCSPIGGLYAPVEEAEAVATLAEAWSQGVRAFDTAPLYGVGLSEERLGKFIATHPRHEIVVSTKVGRLLADPLDGVGGTPGYFGTPPRVTVVDYSRDGARRSIEESCARLGVDRVDIALVHDPIEDLEQALDESYPALEEMRAEGVVGAIGVGTLDLGALERFCLETDIDCIMVAARYSLLDGSAAERLFPMCMERSIAVLAAGIYNSGVLADPRPGATFNYQPVPPELLERVLLIRQVCQRYGVPLAHAAVQYVLGHPAVTAVVIGARSPREVQENALYVRSPAPSDLFAELAAEGLILLASG